LTFRLEYAIMKFRQCTLTKDNIISWIPENRTGSIYKLDTDLNFFQEALMYVLSCTMRSKITELEDEIYYLKKNLTRKVKYAIVPLSLKIE